MADGSLAPVIAGLGIGIAFVVILSIFSPQIPQSVKTKVGVGFTNNANSTLLVEAAKSPSIVKAFLAKYPDASIKIEKIQAETSGAAGTSIPAVDFYKTIHWIAYYNKTTGLLINENNEPIENKTLVVTSANSQRLNISNTIMLTVHISNLSSNNPETGQQPDKIWLSCLTDTSTGSGMTTELGRIEAGIENQTKIENQMIKYIQNEFCFPKNH